MKLKRFSILFTLVLAFSTFFSSFAFASDNNLPKNLLALGDSITYGYNLEPQPQTKPSPNAFPSLIGGKGSYNVTNLGVPGLTSWGLLCSIKVGLPAELFGNVKDVQNKANVITLDIGSNDILQAPGVVEILKDPTAFAALPADQQAALLAKAKNDVIVAAGLLANNLQQIILEIRNNNKTAPIILYNLYNPFGPSTNPVLASLNVLGETVIPNINSQIINKLAATPQSSGIFLADAYTAFNRHQADYILPGDVHPTLDGHVVLADLASDILAPEGDLTVSLTSTPGETAKEPVTIKIETNADLPLATTMKWLAGEKTIADFATAGNNVKDSSFQVTENGKYTVYVKDDEGKEVVATIEIKNITKDPSVPAPTPTTPTHTNTTPPPAAASATGHALPDTATPMFNFLAIGLVVVLGGLLVMKLQQARRKENI